MTTNAPSVAGSVNLTNQPFNLLTIQLKCKQSLPLNHHPLRNIDGIACNSEDIHAVGEARII